MDRVDLVVVVVVSPSFSAITVEIGDAGYVRTYVQDITLNMYLFHHAEHLFRSATPDEITQKRNSEANVSLHSYKRVIAYGYALPLSRTSRISRQAGILLNSGKSFYDGLVYV